MKLNVDFRRSEWNSQFANDFWLDNWFVVLVSIGQNQPRDFESSRNQFIIPPPPPNNSVLISNLLIDTSRLEYKPNNRDKKDVLLLATTSLTVYRYNDRKCFYYIRWAMEEGGGGFCCYFSVCDVWPSTYQRCERPWPSSSSSSLKIIRENKKWKDIYQEIASCL